MNNGKTKPRPSFATQLKELFKKSLRIKQSSFEESVTELIREHNFDSSLHYEEKNILQNILSFGDLDASDVMIPRTDIAAVPLDIKLDNLKNTFTTLGHTRLPVYKNSIDEIIGFIHVKDVFKCLVQNKKPNLKSLTRELIFVPRSIKITDLLAKMKQSTVHIAIVLDEHGGTDGLVTIEDIIEEVFGEITDEYDQDKSSSYITFDGEFFTIDARAKIEDVEKELGLMLTDEEGEYDTFGGMIISFLGHIPQKGEIIVHPSGLEVEITDADHRKVKITKVKFTDNISAS
jgi:magnesium and cobalt transporter